MKLWSPDTRLARAPVDPERSLGSLLLVKSYDTEHPGSQRGSSSGQLWRVYWSEKGVGRASVCLTLGCLPVSPQTERKRERGELGGGGRGEEGAWMLASWEAASARRHLELASEHQSEK